MAPSSEPTTKLVGILAIQGATRPHERALSHLGVDCVLVRKPEDLDGVEALILPGGESTTMSMLLESYDLFDAIAALIERGTPVLGTCAGMILLSSRILDGRDDQRCFGAIDLVVRRNGFGRQVDSFEADLVIDALGDKPFPAVFIRAPIVDSVGPGVEVLAAIHDAPVLCRQGAILVAAFHPELSDDLRLHRMLLNPEPARGG